MKSIESFNHKAYLASNQQQAELYAEFITHREQSFNLSVVFHKLKEASLLEPLLDAKFEYAIYLTHPDQTSWVHRLNIIFNLLDDAELLNENKSSYVEFLQYCAQKYTLAVFQKSDYFVREMAGIKCQIDTCLYQLQQS